MGRSPWGVRRGRPVMVRLSACLPGGPRLQDASTELVRLLVAPDQLLALAPFTVAASGRAPDHSRTQNGLAR